MTRSVNQVKGLVFIAMLVLHLYGVAFNGNSFFAFKIHAVEYLILRLALGKRMSAFK